MAFLKVSCHPAKIGRHMHCGSGDIITLVCQVTLHDHKQSCGLWLGAP